ncbi:hypothetical protein O3G_MSEX000790 [Manduca sexta]|nr:hypothetical protein O3G_MSEX000790 [Manduca sexta]
MLMGWQSPMTPILQNIDGPAPEQITDDHISWMGSITFFPPIFCGIFVGDLADRWGRKLTTLLTSLMLVVSVFIVVTKVAERIQDFKAPLQIDFNSNNSIK